MGKQVKKDEIKAVLEFYRALGVHSVPLPEIIKTPRTKKTVIRKAPPARQTDLRARQALDELRTEIGECRRCKLAPGRTNLVFGEGNPAARLLFIGEGPGREEDMQGRPFVGDAGKLLTRLIEWMGSRRENVYIANVVKCRPPMNRAPEEDEVAACLPFLKRQIEIIGPAVIMTLGGVATHALLNTNVPISKLRGAVHEYAGAPLVPTFHPAYLLRNPSAKEFTKNDARLVLKILKAAHEKK